MPRKKQSDRPADGASVMASPAPPPVNSEIKKMTGDESEQEMLANLEPLPDDGAKLNADGTPKRKRRTKAEMEAARGTAPVAIDPYADDPIIKRFRRKATPSGAAVKVHKIGFQASGKPLNEAETEDVSDYFHAVSVKIGGVFDPMKSWPLMVLAYIIIMGNLLLTRSSYIEKIKTMADDFLASLFSSDEKKDKKDKETEKGENEEKETE